MLDDFDHVTIAVADLDVAVGSYAALLGAPPLWRGEHPGLGTRAALFGLANALVELVGPIDGAPEAEGLRTLVATQGEGFFGFSLGTADAGRCTKLLRERGVRATAPEEGEAHSGAHDVRRFRVVELSRASTRQVPITLVERLDPIARVTPADGAAMHALDHLVIRTADPEAALGLYRDALGIRLALDRMVGDTRMLFFRLGGVTLEVVHDPSLEGADALYGLAYRVADLDRAHARLVGSGVAASVPRDGRKPGTRVFGVQRGTCGVPTLVLYDPARDAPRYDT